MDERLPKPDIGRSSLSHESLPDQLRTNGGHVKPLIGSLRIVAAGGLFEECADWYPAPPMGIEYPKIIQGGMGVGISNWHLARTVSKLGQLGVVSGVALEVLMVRRLQDGDVDGYIRRALEQFPFRDMARRALEKYYIPGGRADGDPYSAIPFHKQVGPKQLHELCILSNFVEVFSAREGHDGAVGINYLEKIQMPHLPSIYGAMLAGVAYVVMGAGVPTMIPGVLDSLSHHEAASYGLNVVGAQAGDDTFTRFDPQDFIEGEPPQVERPRFLPIIASNVLAVTMLRRSNGKVDGFVIEGPTAGGHNAPPRGKLQVNERGEPIYGEKDVVDLGKIRDLGLPFWVAGGCASAENLREVLEVGGTGIQVGTAFALCEESGMAEEYRRGLLNEAMAGTARVVTDRLASPTGFPFKVASLDGSLSEQDVYHSRIRVCDLGYLREVYRKDDGSLGYRCSSEPVESYVAKGGRESDTIGRKCICNSLASNAGLAQIQKDGSAEKPLLTCGDDLTKIARFVPEGQTSYTARDVITKLLELEAV
jgi:nitronate monooxygenase